jgi:hypothetical protein
VAGLWITVLLGVGAVGWLQLNFLGLLALAGHGPPPDGSGFAPFAVGALIALGGVVAIAMRPILGPGSIRHAVQVSAAGFGPFMIGLIAYPDILLSVARFIEGERATVLPLVVMALATVVSLGGVAVTANAALSRDQAGT